ncbi:hypothetical protein V8B55DRAFT_1389679 [Mucor lusitanicus]|uniref:RRM domain-containing protein n=2 Tax=Mucor circinelloides f. lusitanicus TaxID=29924 RepID=A0A8H4BH40_MUCCL|nr:hypothetical protein FB192DRAFT_1437581 [Mucor lusitanicus]
MPAAAAKTKKDTKAPAKKAPVKKTTKATPAQKDTESSKRKRVSFNEESNKKKAVGNKAKKVAVKQEKPVVEEESEDSEEEQVVEKVEEEVEEEDLTEEQEEALRKEILGDMASSDEDEDSSDEEVDAIDSNENIVTLDGKKMEESMTETKKTFDKKSKAVKTPKAEEKGVVYLGRIPHGFYEKEMRGYFSQFGDISRLRLSRNKKTGRSKHYGFIEFESADVAEIVAETMNNYLLFEHMLQCKVIPAEKVHESLFAGADKVYKPFNTELRNRQIHNKKKTPEELEQKCKALKKAEQKLRKEIKEAGIDYDFPSFA